MSISNSRIKAFLVHLVLSASVISVFLYFVLFIWYPYPFDFFYAPIEVLKIVLVVDLVLGPLLTLVLFNIKKPIAELRRDIFIVVLIQISAFMWGVHVTYSTRPVFLVFSNYTFYMFAEDELDLSVLKRKEMLPAFWKSPQFSYLDPPKDKKELEQLFYEFEHEGKPYYRRRTERYLPLHEGFQSIIEFAIDMSEAIKDPAKKKRLDEFLADKEGDMSHYVFFPIVGANKSATVVFNRNTEQLIGVL